MKSYLPIICLIFWLLPNLFLPAYGQLPIPQNIESAPYFFQKQFFPKTYNPSHIIKNSGHYTKKDWAAIIDSTWGPGLPTNEKLQIFDIFWNNIDWYFACFQDLDVNWDSLRTVYRSEIADTVSRGRFAAIMNHLALALKEAHTNCEDKLVNWNTALAPGVPLLVVGGWGENGHFGAGLTPLPDSSLLVYKVVPDHPLSLVPGDIVLGYDKVPWKVLYKELLAAQLPICGWWWGCSESAYVHSWLISAGMNWHLFGTIDVKKYANGDTVHLSLRPLIRLNKEMPIFCTEQLDIPGVPMPNYTAQNLCSYGIVDGTRIGYIYVWGWFWNVETEFLNAVSAIMNNYETRGLIIDFRINYGGNIFLSNPGLSLLFNTQDTTIGLDKRSDPFNHLAMMPWGPSSRYIIPGDSATFYNKPIAILVGPGALSSGDQVALRMKFHPMAKFFGKSTTAAFNSPTELDLGNQDWYCRYAVADAYLVNNPGHYLTHDEFGVDEDVWLTPDDVVQGFDTVVKAAITWIESHYTNLEEPSNVQLASDYKLFQNYPNPFNPSTTITFDLPKTGFVELDVYNIMGQSIRKLVAKEYIAGRHTAVWDGKDDNGLAVTGGVYLYRIQTDDLTATRKMILIR